MTVDESYLRYPQRRYGMDHDAHGWSILQSRAPVHWPADARVALWISIPLEFFPLDQPAQPFKVPGGMVTPYPDLRHFTTRDYGNRVGIQRLWKVLDKYGLKASVAMNSRVAQRYPYLVDRINARGDEIIAHGVDMGCVHYGGMASATEARLVAESVSVLRAASGQPVTGWWSPGKSESWETLKHLVDHDIDYVCDWANDDMPYALRDGVGREITAMPHTIEMSDRTLIIDKKHNEDEWLEQIQDQYTVLDNEVDRYGGRIVSIVLTPYIMGLHYRIKYLDRALAWLTAQPGVWSATGAEILNAFQQSNGAAE